LLIKVTFLCFYNELKFHILSRDGKTCLAITGDFAMLRAIEYFTKSLKVTQSDTLE